MVKKQSYTVIVFGMLLIALAVLLLNNPVNLELPAVNIGSDSRSSGASVAEAGQAETASAARWQAMGEAYTSQGIFRSLEAATADQARWDAAGEFYANKARVADQARWDAAGEYYADRGRVADQARWDAMGEAYGDLDDGR